MFLPGIAEFVIDQFDGTITRLEPYQVPPNKMLYTQNLAFVRGLASTRLGHGSVFSLTDGSVTAMVNWFLVFSGQNVSAIAYYAPSVGVRLLNQLGPSLITIMAVTGAAGTSMVPAGLRLYVAFYDSTGRLGTAGGQVYGWNVGSDPLFAAPLTNVPTMSEPGVGVNTAGIHRIAYLTTTRNGYTGRLQPVNGSGVFSPVTFTASGSKNAQFSLASPFPSYINGAATIQVVMTTVANPNRWYAVPGAVAFAIGSPVNITFSISDSDLAATGTDVTKYLNLLQSSVSGTPPFNPNAVFAYSSRMAYCTIDGSGNPVVYFSDPNNYQYITADQHAIYLEGQQEPIQGCSLRGVCYIGCPSGFYSIADNGGVPVSWTPAQRVDGSIGIIAASCLYANPAQGYALIASERGLYLFQGGIFPPLPLSYYVQSDWGRINWAVPTQIQIGDDQLNKRFIVAAPLTNNVQSVTGTGPYTVTTAITPHLYQTGLSVTIAGVTGAQAITVTGLNTFTIPGGHGAPTVGGLVAPQTMSHEMTWDYTEGDTPEEVKYSLNSFTAYRAASLATIRNMATSLPEIWYAPAANGPMIRQNDGSETNPYRDVDMSFAPAAINALGETALAPPPLIGGQMTLHDFHGCHATVRGNGNLTLLAKGLNGVITTVPARSPLPLQATPSGETLVKWFLRSEHQSLQFGTNAIDAFFVLSLLRMYYTDAMAQR